MTDKPIDEIIQKLRMYCSMTGRKPDGIEGVDYEILSEAQIMVKVSELKVLLDKLHGREIQAKALERDLHFYRDRLEILASYVEDCAGYLERGEDNSTVAKMLRSRASKSVDYNYE